MYEPSEMLNVITDAMNNVSRMITDERQFLTTTNRVIEKYGPNAKGSHIDELNQAKLDKERQIDVLNKQLDSLMKIKTELRILANLYNKHK